MNSVKKVTGLAIATAAASMFALAVPLTASADEGNVKCMGVNACKGHSSCKTANSSCKGQNSCKGQGFVEVNKAVCDQLGGSAG
jgi:uncharacterized membrane protein